eukprot:TRINITY_DN894_c0_g2_i1.p1 TRINITY_DN894_c0_g2~~TRINITY_DN894_c0_g2_i1.p1  ORF type:complete len:498 (+),score=115.26 TRINITY_DN894_c0_g2_i1:119-1612(+)
MEELKKEIELGEDASLLHASDKRKSPSACLESCFSSGFLLIFLTLVNVLNYFDRGVMASVLPKVKDDFDLTYFESGVLASVFMLGFMIAAPVFAQLSYHFPGTVLMGIGELVWVGAATGTALAPNYLLLVCARVLSGVGEASFCGLAPTVIDNKAPRDKRTLWLSIFFAAIPVGYALGYLGGGLFASQLTWQMAFLFEAALMFPCALICFCIPHDANKTSTSHDEDEASKTFPLGVALKMLFKNPIFVLTVLGYSCYTFVLGGIAFWMPTFLYHHLNLSLQSATMIFGVVSLLTGVFGTGFGGVMIDRLGGSAHIRGTSRALKWCWIASLIGFPFAFAAVLTSNIFLFFSLLFLAEFALFSTTAPSNGATLSSVPLSLRSHSMALCIFMIHLLGDFPSPLIVGVIADSKGLQFAILIMLCWLIMAVLMWFLAQKVVDTRIKRLSLLSEINIMAPTAPIIDEDDEVYADADIDIDADIDVDVDIDVDGPTGTEHLMSQ